MCFEVLRQFGNDRHRASGCLGLRLFDAPEDTKFIFIMPPLQVFPKTTKRE